MEERDTNLSFARKEKQKKKKKREKFQFCNLKSLEWHFPVIPL
jgi:hypothetical protein